MTKATLQQSSIRSAALAGVPDDGVVHVDQLAKDPLIIRTAKVVPNGEGTAVWWMGDDRLTFQVLSHDTGGAYAFWVDEPGPQEGPPKHVHSREEGFCVLGGEATFQAGHARAALGPGSFIALPVGIPHNWSGLEFVDPSTKKSIKRISLPVRPHEIAISMDNTLAYITVCGDGIYGNNIHRGHQLDVIVLTKREKVGEIELNPFQSRLLSQEAQRTPLSSIASPCD